MATETLKATALTNLDATPPLVMGPSTGGPGVVRTIDGTVTPASGKTVGSLYKLIRLNSNVRLKELKLKLDATMTTFDCDIGFYYSDSTQDNTPVADQGAAVNGTTGSQYFGINVALAALTTSTDLMSQSATGVGVNTVAANFDKELWEICGLATDPHCPFDITLTSTTTANSGSSPVYMKATYIAG
jgi:hypothetical protein